MTTEMMSKKRKENTKLALNFGLDNTGFTAPTYDEILDSIETDMQAKFGNDIVLTSNSNFGIIARLMSWYIYQVIDQLQQTYYSGFVSTATGTALDRLANNVGITRKVAMPAFGQITIKTSGEYLLQAGEQFETDGGVMYELIGDTMTSKQSDGSYQATGDIQCIDAGSLGNTAAGTVTIMSNPDDNVLSVTNPSAIGGGQDDESDEDFRKRIITESKSTESATINGLETALLGLSGVRQVKVETVSESDNSENSVYIYCLGGDKNAIAQTIAQHVALGVQLKGDVTEQVADYTGQLRDYSFSFAQELPIYATVEVTTNTAWDSDNGPSQIQSAVADYINTLNMGDTVRWTKAYPDIYNVNGVEEADVKIGTSADSVASADITVASRQVATCQEANVKVVVK